MVERQYNSDWHPSSVHLPDGKVQRAGKTDPTQIGQQQIGRKPVHGIKNSDRRGNGKPEKHDVEKGQIRTAQAKETSRPRRIEDKACKINAQRRCETNLAPHHPSRYRHGDVEKGPGRREQEAWRPPPGLGKRVVPSAGAEKSPRQRCQKTDTDKTEQNKKGWNAHMLILCITADANERRSGTCANPVTR